MIKLKKGREKPIIDKHHWIFSGAVESMPSTGNGQILPVCDSKGNLLGHAMYNPRVSIIGRMISFGSNDPLEEIRTSIERACQMRQNIFNSSETNAYRLINGEGDGLPGLVVDRYHNVLVIQILTFGMDNIRELIIEELIKHCKPHAIYEKSTKGSRTEEGLQSKEGFVFGNFLDEIEIIENGIKFLVSPEKGQKTGFFLDQRSMRKQIQELSHGKKVLNCFSYTGGFSVYALKGGALHVDSIDSSHAVQELTERNVQINHLDSSKHRFIRSDVIDFIRKNPLEYDIVILDPPAYAKRRGDLEAACKGYRELNRLTMEKMPSESWLLTCSCSAHLPQDVFQKVIFQAAVASGRKIQIMGRHQLAFDHPINIFHPENEYLKSLLLYVQ